uniref:Uncharacterized protein n=1 Tax=Spongospora subterranea TaxID=70186 RepID=A0A0H5RBV2_9EUKA|eukprot:CRZ11082.1 hypothetical protein [Spongospora subterranea]
MSETRDRISERRTRSREDIHFADYEANRRSVSIERRNPERGHRSVDEYHSKRRRGASVEREKSGGKNQDSGNHKTENETRAFSGYGSKGNRTKRLKSNRN